MKKIFILLLTIIPLLGCTKTTQKNDSKEIKVNIPAFSADSAFQYVQNQVDFGPRVPNTQAHIECAEYLATELKRFGALVIEQKVQLQAYDGTALNSVNIIGSFNQEQQTRIALFAHWDTRPWADNDPNPENHNKPVMGANDGASGVGVLLEIARQMGQNLPTIGIDIIFVDAEDYGASGKQSNANTENSWCLGTQYWAKNPHKPGYRARYGILLDMVGAPNAKFYREQASDFYAESIVTKVWSQAQSLGFTDNFINKPGGSITDDHIYVNQIAGIPCIDIIQFDPNTKNGFGSYWHTINDTMENIDTKTLNAVGTTLMHVIYTEKTDNKAN